MERERERERERARERERERGLVRGGLLAGADGPGRGGCDTVHCLIAVVSDAWLSPAPTGPVRRKTGTDGGTEGGRERKRGALWVV